MKQIISRLILLVGLSLLFDGCGGGSETSSFNTTGSTTQNPNPNGTDTTIVDNGQNSNSGTDSTNPNGTDTTTGSTTQNPNPSGGTTIVDNSGTDYSTNPNRTKKLLFVDATCQGLTLTAISSNNSVVGTVQTGSDGIANIPTDTAYVQFEIGGIILGKVNASGVIAISELFKNANINDQRVLFVSRLLLTIDSDSNPANGINITSVISSKLGTFKSSTGDTFSSFDKTKSEVDLILAELIVYLGVQKAYSETEAKAHLESSMTQLEEGVTTVSFEAGQDNNCPNGGIKQIHNVDFNKADTNSSLSQYVDYFCDETTNLDRTKSYILEIGNDKCPDGGFRIHHKIYVKNSRTDDLGNILSEYDEYRCTGSTAYKNNSFIIYSLGESSESCSKFVVKTTNITNDKNVSIKTSSENICLDNSSYNVSIEQLLSDSICKFNGLRVSYLSGSVIANSEYLCNQRTVGGYITGEHKIISVEANSSTCPNGGTEFKHSVDSDNNGKIETFYSEIKCRDYNASNDPNLKVTVTSTNILLTLDMSDSKNCPYGGYRIERVMKQGDKIIAEYNDYNCTTVTAQLIRDDMNPVVLKASEYSKNSLINSWCPNGGFKYEHKVYFNNILNHQYFDINCSPASTSESNKTIELAIGNLTCPYGGKIVIHSVRFNNDTGHPSNYEFNTTHCSGFEFNNTVEIVKTINSYTTSDNSTCKVEAHSRLLNGIVLSQFDFNTTTCDGLDWNETSESKSTELIAFGDKRCPDGGQLITYKRLKADGSEVSNWTYQSVICQGLDYNETREVIEIAKTLSFGDKICPYGGKIETHKRFTKDTNEHIARWDYNTTVCGSVEYNETTEVIETVRIYNLGDKVCPDGGKVELHKRYIADQHILYWDYNSTICEGLDWNETYEIVVIVNAKPTVCPFGGRVVTHKRFTKDTNEHVLKWDFNTTTCSGLDYNQTQDKPIIEILAFGSKTCPDGGRVISHKRYFGDIHIAKWDYSETICNGLDYNQTLEYKKENILDFGNNICPDGGKIYQVMRYIDSDNDDLFNSVKNNFSQSVNYNYSSGLNPANSRTTGVIEITNPDSTPGDISRLTYDENIANNLGLVQTSFASNGQIIFNGNVTVGDFEALFRTVKLHSTNLDVGKNYKITFSIKGSETSLNGNLVIGTVPANPETSESLETTLSKWVNPDVNITGYTINVQKDLTVVTTNRVADLSEHVSTGLGVTAGQIQWTYNSSYPDKGYADRIVIDFAKPITDITVGFSGLGPRFVDSAKAVYEFYRNGELVRQRGKLDRSEDFDGDGHIATNLTKTDLTIDRMIFTISIDGSVRNTANYSLRYITASLVGLNESVVSKTFDVTIVDQTGSDIHVEKWDYNYTVCNGLDYNQTTEKQIVNILSIGSKICPDGGKIITYQRWFGDTHISKWDYTSTFCKGLDYNETIEKTIETNASAKECPYGGLVIQHQRWLGDEHITKWDYNTTHCTGDIIYRQDVIAEYILPVGNSECPDGGKIVTFKQTNNNVQIGEFNSTFCGLEGASTYAGDESNFTVAGYIKDMNGSRISGAKVSVSVNGKLFEVVTGSNGVYQIYNIQRGAVVTVSADGYIVVQKPVLSNDGRLDFILVSEDYLYVKDLKLMFLPNNRKIGGDIAQELAKTKGWRLLTFNELLALYYSERRSEFANGEYFSSTHEADIKDGYTLWSVRFPDGQLYPHWFNYRKHVVFVDDEKLDEVQAINYSEIVNSWSVVNTAKTICSIHDKRLPTVAEMKNIYLHSSHPFGVADTKLSGGEYWTSDSTFIDVNDSANVFFRVVGPVEDYYVEKNGDGSLPKKVICIKDYINRTVTITGLVTNSMVIKFERIDSTGQIVSSESKTHKGGEFSFELEAGRYLVSFDNQKYMTYDFSYNQNLGEINLSTGDSSDDDSICEFDQKANNCDRVIFNAFSQYDIANKKWSYSVIKGAEGNVNKLYYTIKIGSVCMEQISNLSGGTAIALNDLGIIDAIKVSEPTNEMSFVLDTNITYEPDVETALAIVTDSKSYLASIASPICQIKTIEEPNNDVNMTVTILDNSGKPIADALVNLYDENNQTLGVHQVDANGFVITGQQKAGTKIRFDISAINYISASFYGTPTSSVNSFSFSLEKATENIRMFFNAVDSLNGNLITNSSCSLKIDNSVVSTSYSNSSGICEINISREIGSSTKGIIAISANGYQSKTIENFDVANISKYPVQLDSIPSTLLVNIYTSSGEKVDKAEVNIYKENESVPIYSGISDDGKISFESIIAGNYTIRVSLSNYELSSQSISIKVGEDASVFAIMTLTNNSSSSEIKTIEASASDSVLKYQNSSVKGSSTFKATVKYSSTDKIWTYKIERVSYVGAGAELSHWYLDLNDKCLHNLEDVTEKYLTGIDGSTSNIVSNSNSVLKWDTNGGTFKFKIKDGVEFDASSSIKVPLLFKAGTVGNLSKEGFVIVNIPAPVCK